MTAGWLWELALAGGSPLLQLVKAITDAGPAMPWQAPMAALLAVLVALLVDRLWGEPPVRLHPVVYMGQLLGLLGQAIAPRQAQERAYGRFVLAALAWCALAAGAWLVYAALQWLLQLAPWWLGAVLAGLLLKPLLSWRMLRSEVLAVEAALSESLEAGRARLSWLVSRDTSQLDAATVRESAIETLAENLSDSVLAPLFWFAVAGLPGAALYRLANTADAMWGYPGWRGQGAQRRHWQWAGKWAARADDVLNWLPARMTAAWLALLAGGLPWSGLRRDAAVTPSPNGGWPMGAMARALGLRLSKPGVYQLNPQGRPPQAADMQRALALAGRVVWAQALCALLLALGLAMILGIASMGQGDFAHG